jgi:signal transduction histidine kinase
MLLEAAVQVSDRLFDHLPDAALVVEPGSRRITEWNAAAEHLFGYPARDALGQPVDEVITGLRLDASGPGAYRLRGQTRGGAALSLETSVGALPAEPGQAPGVLVIARALPEPRRTRGPRRRTPRTTQARLQALLERQQFLDHAGRELADSLDYETTLRTIAWLPVPRLASVCVVQTLDEDLVLDRVAVAHADSRCAVELQSQLDEDDAESQRERPPASSMLLDPLPRLLAADAAQAWSVLGLSPHLQSALRKLPLQEVLIVPLVRGGRALGALLLGAETEHAFAGRLDLAQDLARRCALALEHASLYRTAQQAITARDQFLSIAAHELRAPLTRIKAHAEMLLLAQSHAQLEPERLAWSAERINAAVDRLATLTTDVLDVARLRGSKMPFRPRALDLVELLGDLGPRFGEHLGDGHHLVLELSDEPCPVLVDEERIEQILVNLLQNAGKYSPNGADVIVSVRPVDDGVLLQVRDQGVGLPAGSQERIFEPFGRAANAERLNVPGMGLGLHICRMMVERHGGRIWAESAGEDQGSTFSVWLPFAIDSTMPIGDVQERLTNQLTLAAGYCELLATSPDLPECLRAQAREAMHGAQVAVATLGDLRHLVL